VEGDRTQVLLVDLGGVLFSFDHQHRLSVLGQCLGLPPGRVDELLWQSGFSAGCDAGRHRDAAAVRAQIRRITGDAGPDERLDAAWCSAFCPDPDVIGLPARRPGGRRGVFTSNGPLDEEDLDQAVPGCVRAVRAPVLLLAPDREQA
jgi:glucose-1-phosphatase